MILRSIVLSLLTFAIVAPFNAARGQATQPATAGAEDPALRELARLRDALKDAYNRGDVDRMLTYLHPNVLIIFPDGEVLHGREALRGYYDRMLKGPSPVVSKYTAEPVVDGRQIRGDVDLSWGRMNDQYVLTDGTEFGLDSRFTATLLKSPDGPSETGGWIIRSFHSSTDAFDNEVLGIAARRSLRYGALAGVLVGLLVGLIAAFLFRKQRGQQVPT